MDVEGVWYVQDSDSHVAWLSHGNDSVWVAEATRDLIIMGFINHARCLTL